MSYILLNFLYFAYQPTEQKKFSNILQLQRARTQIEPYRDSFARASSSTDASTDALSTCPSSNTPPFVKTLHKKLEIFIREASKHNIVWIEGMITELSRIFATKPLRSGSSAETIQGSQPATTGKHIPTIQTKMNSLYFLQQLLMTCEYCTLNMVETYLLSHLVELCLYRIENPSLQQSSQYFTKSEGYPSSTPAASELSHNYIQMASELLFFAGMVKTKATYENQQLNKESLFFSTMCRIKEKGLHDLSNSLHFKKKYVIFTFREKYKQQLEEFKGEKSYFYIDYYMKKLQNDVLSKDENQKEAQHFKDSNPQNIHESSSPNKKSLQSFSQKQLTALQKHRSLKTEKHSHCKNSVHSLDYKLLLKKGDVYLSSEASARLAEILDFFDDFTVKNKALSIINELILWGDLETILMVNYTDYIAKIAREVSKVEGEKGLQKGELIYAKSIEGQLSEKKRFYGDFLRCIHIWGVVFPTESSLFSNSPHSLQDDKPSPINKIFKHLFEVRRFQFPANPFLCRIEKEIRENLRLHEEKNQLIVDSLRAEQCQTDNYVVAFSEVSAATESAKNKLLILRSEYHGFNLAEYMKFLARFSHSFELELERVDEPIRSEQELDRVIETGLVCVELIKTIEPFYDKLLSGKTTEGRFYDACRKAIDPRYFEGKLMPRDTDDPENSFSEILNRKSELRLSISRKTQEREREHRESLSATDKSSHCGVRNIKDKYLMRLERIASRANSEKDESFLNTSGFLNTKTSCPSTVRHSQRLPIESNQEIQRERTRNKKERSNSAKVRKRPVQNAKAIAAHDSGRSSEKLKAKRSPRSHGNKIFVFSKALEENKNLKKEETNPNFERDRMDVHSRQNSKTKQDTGFPPNHFQEMLLTKPFSFLELIGHDSSTGVANPNECSTNYEKKGDTKRSSRSGSHQYEGEPDSEGADRISLMGNRQSQSSSSMKSPDFGNTASLQRESGAQKGAFLAINEAINKKGFSGDSLRRNASKKGILISKRSIDYTKKLIPFQSTPQRQQNHKAPTKQESKSKQN